MIYIALLRGINVGGRNKLPMKELAALLANLGLTNVKTYIQSGNVVFQSDRTDTVELGKEIGAAIEENHGFKPNIHILGVDELQAAIAANPFPEGEDEPKTLHLIFLDGVPSEFDQAALDKLKIESERYQLLGKVFYLHAPDGVGRSKLAAAAMAGKGWGVSVTARNWRTATKVMEMALALEESK